MLVERVEHLITDEACARAYDEINAFEESLTDQGTLVLDSWLHIDKDGQPKHFKDREKAGHKEWKITDDNWRNRDNWDLY